jgi:hypothetical protein
VVQGVFLSAHNKALKSLVVVVEHGTVDAFASAFRLDVATMLQENMSLETLTVRSGICKAKQRSISFSLAWSDTIRRSNPSILKAVVVLLDRR